MLAYSETLANIERYIKYLFLLKGTKSNRIMEKGISAGILSVVLQ